MEKLKLDLLASLRNWVVLGMPAGPFYGSYGNEYEVIDDNPPYVTIRVRENNKAVPDYCQIDINECWQFWK